MDIYNLALVIVILLLSHRLLFRHFQPNLPLQSSNSPPTNRSTKKSSTPRGVRLLQVHPPPEENTKTDVDVIAIHGLDTRSPDTWIWKSEPGKPGVNWLSDKNMLPSIVTSARIFMCDWPSDLFEHSDYSQKTFDEFARLLLAGIAARPRAANSSRQKERPILFIASCLGGIVLMKALVRTSPEYHSVQRAVRGIVFLATPFSGTSFRDVAEWALPGLKTLAFIRAEKVSNLLYETKSNSELVKLRRDFTTLCKEIGPLHMAAFYETGKTSLPRKLIPWLPGFLAQEKPLVGEESATLDVIHDPLPLERTHLLMNKFSGPSDEQYNVVAGRIHNILERIREGRPLEMADAHINNTCYKAKRLEIERISGELLPMERCYVNLVVIEHPTNRHQKVQEGAQQSSQFSLHSRLNIETPDEDIQVDMRHLFDQRKGDSGVMIQPKRILIRGHAGVGKSTLCKKIVHDFKELDMWPNMFVRILWVPLRNLKRLNKAKCNLEAMLHEEYFSQISKGNEFASELWKELEEDKYKETLFILDGLDEVYEGLEKDNHMFNLLETLLNLPTVIVTSRPHVALSDRLELKFDLELETIGFYPDQVKSYVENVFTIPGEREPDHQKIDGLQLLLQKHQLLQGLVRIPIQLDALCYIWSDDNSSLRDGSALETMTGIYQAIVERLWKKDIPRLQKKEGGEMIAKMDLHDASLKTIETYVHDELYLLERLAFTGMVNDVISFRGSDDAGILDRKNSQILPTKTLPRLSFLRTSDPSPRDTIYHFLHLTFQEYFAARYFVRQWEAEKPLLLGKDKPSKRVETFLAHHKYDARYDIFWRFVAGLLSLQGKKICGFFQLIEDEPLDLLGPVHERLVMHCLSEVPPAQAAFSAEREKLECQLGRWLAFECKFMGEAILTWGMEFPEALLKNVLESASMEERSILVNSLAFRPAIPPRVIRLVCSWLQNNISRSLNIDILEMLTRYQGALDNEVLGAIVARFEDEDERVQRAAVDALERWSPLRNDILDDIVTQAIDKESPVQQEAIRLLGSQSQLDDKVINALVAQLEDKAEPEPVGSLKWRREAGIREVIIETLARQPQHREEVLRVISTQLKHKGDLVEYKAVRLLKDQPDRSDNFFRTITTLLVDDEDISTRRAALEVLGSWPQPNEKILDIVRAYLGDQDWCVREAVIDALGTWPELNHNILDMVAEHLKDVKRKVRSAALETLASQPQLSHDILEAIKATARDKDEDVFVRADAIKILMKQQGLDDDMHNIITAWLHDEDKRTRSAALGALCYRPRPSKEIVDLVVAQLEEDSWVVRRSALGALGCWPQLSDTVLDAIAVQLSDGEKAVREAAARAFRDRPRPQDNVIKAIVTRLQNPWEMDPWYIQELLEALANWPRLDDYVLYAVAKLLAPQSPHDHQVVEAAVKVFRTRPQPKDHIINAIMKHLENPNQLIEKEVLQAIGSWSRLSDKFLVTIATHLGAEKWGVRQAAFYALTNQSSLPFAVLEPYMEFMYKVSLEISFKEHVYWLAKNGQSFIVVGARKVHWRMTEDDTVRKSNTGRDRALWLRDSAPAWRERCGFSTQAPWGRWGGIINTAN
ncbi:armadillo-type protein [Ustulina deusta]|nr:armadillo-type protein [Ustulina deusta]